MPNIIEITDLSISQLDIYARLPEVQLGKIYKPQPGIFLAETRIVNARASQAGYEPVSFLVYM